jgi:hypothetical protein
MLNSQIPVTAALALFGLLILMINEARGAVQVRQKMRSIGPFSIGAALIAAVLLSLGIAGTAVTHPATSYSDALTGGLFVIPGLGLSATGATVRDSLLTMPPILIAAAGLLMVVVALIIVRYERRQPAFQPEKSTGLLNVGVGLFTLVAALLIPLIPLELNSAQVGLSNRSDGAALAMRSVSSPSPSPRAIPPTVLPSVTPTVTPFNTATPLPPLTATESETPIVLYTVIPYTSTYAIGLSVLCTVTTTGQINLRGEPSIKQQAIGSVYSGALLNVLGHTSDSKWWHVVSIQGGVNVTGWVSGDFIRPDSYCSTVPVVNNAGNILSATYTPAPSTATAVVSATPVLCVIMTSVAASLRPDPSSIHNALAGIPDKMAFIPIGRSADGAWWQIAYQDKIGWITDGAVVASSVCSKIPAPTTTPATVQP